MMTQRNIGRALALTNTGETKQALATLQAYWERLNAIPPARQVAAFREASSFLGARAIATRPLAARAAVSTAASREAAALVTEAPEARELVADEPRKRAPAARTRPTTTTRRTATTRRATR